MGSIARLLKGLGKAALNRIVHISDLHLRHHLPGAASIPTRLSREMPELFAQAIERIAALSPDLLVLTGDLLDYPLDALADVETQSQARLDLALIADLLDELTCPLAVVYGNHDHPALFHEFFGHLPADRIAAGHRVVSFLDDEGEGNVPLRTGSERRRFTDVLADEASPPQIHVQHYVVWPERNEGYPHTYGDGAEMRDAIIAGGVVRLVLSGHYHRGVAPLFDKGVTFVTVPAFCEFPHPFWVYDLSAGGVHHSEHVLAR
jgi:Icc protein